MSNAAKLGVSRLNSGDLAKPGDKRRRLRRAPTQQRLSAMLVGLIRSLQAAH